MTVLVGTASVRMDLCGRVVAGKSWMPACAGMTVLVGAWRCWWGLDGVEIVMTVSDKSFW
jgi:hypothetical protein